MAGFNPCYCWNLKDGCVTVGIWTLTFALFGLAIFSWQTAVIGDCRYTLTSRMTYYCPDYCPCQTYTRYHGGEHILMFSLCQLAVLGWQTDIIKWLKDKAGNDRLGPNFGVWKPEHERWPGYYEEYWMTGKEKHYLGLFVIQILNLIAAFFLLFASVALIYGIHTSSKYLVWPWFPCIAAAIICSLAYCVMWWVGDVTGYWLVLTVVEVISVFINLYCLFCVIVQYRRIVRGYLPASEDDSLKNQQLIGYEYPYQGPGDTGVLTYAPEKKVGEGVWNVMYEPEGSPRSRVQVYGKDAYGRPVGAPGQLVAYSTEPIGGGVDEQAPGAGREEFPCSKSEMTEEWLKNVVNPDEPKFPVLEHPPSPGKERPYSRSKSLDALEKAGRDKGRRSIRSAKSKESVTSKRDSRRGRRDSSCSTCSSSSSETVESDRKGRTRSESRHRGRRGSDSDDTGYMESAADRKHKKHRHHHHHHHHGHKSHGHRHKKDKSDDDHRARKRLRDVKREDKERRLQQQQQQEAQVLEQQQAPPIRPETSSSTDRSRLPPGAVPVFPFGPGGPVPPPGAISIPQHIVIPPQPKGVPHQPQRFHINSEITISYSDRSAPGSDSEHRPPSGGPMGPRPPHPASAPGVAVLPAVTSVPSVTRPVPPPRNGNGNGNGGNHNSNSAADVSGDSTKGYGSTAV